MAEQEVSFAVDGIQLDPDNQEFKMALEYALYTNTSLYLTGKAGSGKTTFLKYLRTVAKKKMVVLAPTGVAAVNAGGQTIHSFFQIAPSIYVPNDKRFRTSAPIDDQDQSTVYDNFQYRKEKKMLIKKLDLLVIDEVSMVRADLLDAVDSLLRVFRRNNQPFGGVQVILIGDTFQLPPVVTGSDKDLLYRFYDSEFFFSAKVMARCKPLYIELKKIYRQNERDFIDLLNRVRVNSMLPSDFTMLKGKLDPRFKPSEDDHYIILATTNNRVIDINNNKLAELKTPVKTYTASIEGDFPMNIRPTETNLSLKVGAQVMFVKNDRDKRFYNGKIGKVTATEDELVKVEVETSHGESEVLSIEPEKWKNIVYRWDEKEKCIKEDIIGTFTQYPLRLAWAVTVHKSQGLTFEKVVADIGSSFASGQVYVALSRCTSMNGLVLTSEIYPHSIITDNRVLEFAKNETPETLLTEQLSVSKADYYYMQARKAFHARKADRMLDNFLTALKYRNDITTDTFRRYISIWLKKLFKVENDYIETKREKFELLQHVEDLQDCIGDLISEKEELSNSVTSITSENEEKEKSIKKAQKSIVAKDEEISSLKDKLSSVELKLKDSREKISGLQSRVDAFDKECRLLKAELNAQKEENKRISSLTWYQKLFGKK